MYVKAIVCMVVCVMAQLALGGDFDGWSRSSAGTLDATGGRFGTAAIKVSQGEEGIPTPWVSPLYPVTGPYVRASAWMKVAGLYYHDFGFFGYASVEFVDAAGKALKEEPFVLSRQIMDEDPLLEQRMLAHDRRLTFDWRYRESAFPAPEKATQARIKFGLSARCRGEVWLDDVALTFSDRPAPAEVAGQVRDKVPPIEVRLRTPEHAMKVDPLGPIFFPGEDPTFCVQVPESLVGQKNLTLVSRMVDLESFAIWQNKQAVGTADKWAKVVVPKDMALPYEGRYLAMRFTLMNGETICGRAELSFGYLEQFRRDTVLDGPDQRYIVGLRSTWNRQYHERFWMQRCETIASCSMHVKNIWSDASQPPDLGEKLSSFYRRPEILHDEFKYGVVVLVNAGAEPEGIPAFSHLAHHALPTPQSLKTFVTAAAKRFPNARYWKCFVEKYRHDVPGYREAFVECQKAFYEAVKSVSPDAVVIMDNSSIRDDGRGLFELGVFKYCDAIDPHLYGEVEPVVFGFFAQEKQLLESWGVKKRWISLEMDPVPGAGISGQMMRWASEELAKNMSAFFALGGEKACVLGSGAIADPSDPFYADAHGGPGYTPTLNYFAYRRFVKQIGTTPAVGAFSLGETKVRYTRFADAQKTVIVLWSREGSNTIQVSTASPITVIDNVRTAATIQPAGGVCYVTVGAEPLYLRGQADMQLTLAGEGQIAKASGGGLLAGGRTQIVLNVPEAKATSARIIAPPGLEVSPTTAAVENGQARFSVSFPAEHEEKLVTLSFTYGRGDAPSGVVIQRYAAIRPIRAEIWSDGAMENNHPRYRVRIVNENPVAASGHVVAFSPWTSDKRPAEIDKPFSVAAGKSVDLPMEFTSVEMPPIEQFEQRFPAVAYVFADGATPFAVRDAVSLASLVHVKRGLRIDGDVSDWPGERIYRISSPQQYIPITQGAKAGDARAEAQVAWDRANLYFAVKVRGKDALKTRGIKIAMTNAQDKRMADAETKDDYRSYAISFDGEKATLQARTETPDAHGVVYAARRVADGIDYEVAIPCWETRSVIQIDPDRWVRLSLAVIDQDDRGMWQWNGGVSDPKNYGAYGDYQLAAYGKDEWGQFYGCPMAGGRRERQGYVGIAAMADGGRVLVRVTDKEKSQAIVQDAQGRKLREFELPVGERIHTVDVDQQGRLIVGDYVQGVNFYSLPDGKQIPLGPTRGFYPKRHIVEYRSQGVAQDAQGNYFVTIVRKSRTGWSEVCPTRDSINQTKISGVTMFDAEGKTVSAFGQDLQIKNAMAEIHVFGTMGERVGAFLYAEGVAVDSAGRLWISDIDAQTIQVFEKGGAGVYQPLPAVYQAMPKGLAPCRIRPLADGKVLLWNSQKMAVASVVNGAMKVEREASLNGKVVDLKVQAQRVLTLEADGVVRELPLP